MTGILSAFDPFPEEGATIGRLVVGYGELEFELLVLLSFILGNDSNHAAKVLFRTRGEEQRIQVADALLRKTMRPYGFFQAYEEVIADMGFCRRVRNQYAHAHWHEDGTKLFFIDAEAGAKTNDDTVYVKFCWVDLALLRKQEAYLAYVRDAFWYVRRSLGEELGIPGEPPGRRPKKLQRLPLQCEKE